MPIAQSAPPGRSRAKLALALPHFRTIKETHGRWMKFGAHSALRTRYAQPVYSIRLEDFHSGQSLARTLRRVGWMYFLRDRERRLACGEVSILKGAHRNARLSEGPFVQKTFQQIERVRKDPRIRGHRFELRSIRIESLHFFTLWLKGPRRSEYFIPVTPLGSLLSAGKWSTRAEFEKALLPEVQRVRTALERMRSLRAKI